MLSVSLLVAIAALVLALLALTAVIITSRKQAQVIERQQQRLMMLTESASEVLALKQQLNSNGNDFAQTEQLQQSLEQSVKQQLDQQSERLQQQVKQLTEEQHALQQKFEQLSQQDPGAKLYQRAAKLVAGGASVEEIMQECDLPRAEAELIAAMRK
ncbi:MAG: DUF2802 domain-containing protein [Pseudomonadota bacterium]